MTNKPILSIVTPTRGSFSEDWLKQLLEVKGDVEFILVHPVGVEKIAVEDSRVQQIVSPITGELIQRMTALLNASGTYVLSINCDEYVHPEIVSLVSRYFARFPESWVLRLYREGFVFGDKDIISRPWAELPAVEKISLSEVPIAPLTNKFNIGLIRGGRKDHKGRHLENFDKKVWKNCIVQEALSDLIKTMISRGHRKYIPFWALDRLLGLYIQAKFFKRGLIIGHWMPGPAQIRIEDNPPEYKRSGRFYLMADVLLIKRFPQYGYFWNLFFDQLWAIPKRAVGYLGRRLFRHSAKRREHGV